MRSLHPWLLLLAACATPPAGPATPSSGEGSVVEQAREALDRGDLSTAHALLRAQLIRETLIEVNSLADGGELELALVRAQELFLSAPDDPSVQDARRRTALLLGARRLHEARTLHSQGKLRDALAILDEVVKLTPQDADAHALRGTCVLALGIEEGDPLLFDDARREFLLAAQEDARPDAWIGASRASRLLYYDGFDRSRIEEAVLLAREGVRAVEAGALDVEQLTLLPSQVHAEAAFDLYRAARQTEETEIAAAAASETMVALEKCIGTRPEEGWAWLTLSSLLEWEDQIPEARDVLRNALSLLPNDADLHSNHARLCRAIGGFEEVVSAYAHFTEEHPDSALGNWYYAVDTFEQALAGLGEDEDTRDSFRRAEAAFGACRALESSYAESSLGYEVICRAGAGWAMFKAGEVDAAQRAFLSMEEVFEGGLAWSIEDRMFSGLVSLDHVVAHHYQRQLDESLPLEERRASLLEAATLSSFLHGYALGDGRRANDAGFLNRDAGVALAWEAERVLRASMAQGDDAELGKRARALYALARGHMNASVDAYSVASMLLPGDARVVNDTGLILTYYLQRDLDKAASHHLRAITAGRAQLAKVAAGEAEADPDIVTAVGDAYQNLGYLELTLRGASGAAREWFHQCVEFDPVGRELIHQVLLPLCDLIEAGVISAEEVRALYRWGVDDAESLRAKDALTARIDAATAAARESDQATPDSILPPDDTDAEEED